MYERIIADGHASFHTENPIILDKKQNSNFRIGLKNERVRKNSLSDRGWKHLCVQTEEKNEDKLVN